jgi:hypothetical protein
MNPAERRRHVRMKPIQELPASAVLDAGGLVHEVIQVSDIGVGGIALVTAGPLERATPGELVTMTLRLARYGEHTIRAYVRWKAGGLTGLEFHELDAPSTTAVRRYVAELLERGAPS